MRKGVSFRPGEMNEKNMAYQALYRKWRPKTFNDVVGQSHVIQTLKNEINSKKTAHAYLFCGTRGTGKTSCAKIFARAINCLNPVDGNPCNECEICKGAMDGTILDITEIDAASNNGVDDIRQIRDEVMYSAVHAKHKIYIIDEVHMLSDGAFNALLKTLEEPPPYVVFILATTEAHALPATITSRCQRFDFKRILAKDIVLRLREICAAENIKISVSALELIARLADGALRDALSILDQCVCALPDGIDIDGANEVLGIASDDTLNEAVLAIGEHDSSKALLCIDSVVKSGRDLNYFMDTLIRRFRDIMVSKVSPDDKGELFSYGEDTTLTIKKQSVHFDVETVSYILNVLCDSQAKAKYSKSMKIIYELALIRLCNRQLDSSNEAVMQRLARLENMVKTGDFSVRVAPKAGNLTIDDNKEIKEENKIPDDKPPFDVDECTEKKSENKEIESTHEEIKKTQELKRPSQFGTWADILKLLKTASPPLHGALVCKKAKISDGYIYFLNDGYTKTIVSCMKKQFDEAASCVLGYTPKIKYVNQGEFDSITEDLAPQVEKLKRRAESVIQAEDEKNLNEPKAEEDDFSEDDAPPEALEEVLETQTEEEDPLDSLLKMNNEDIHLID